MGGRQKKKGNKKATGQKKAKSKTEQQPEPEPEPEREPEPQPQPGLGFGKGDLVLIHGLTGAPQHNGKTGTVLSFAEATGRYRVQLHGEPDTKPLGLKPANLTLEDDDDADPHPEDGLDIDSVSTLRPAKPLRVDDEPLSFEDILRQEKEAEKMDPAELKRRAEEEAAAARAEAADREAADDRRRAREAHAELWAKVDVLTPTRDQWHVKWQALEAEGEKAVLDSTIAEADAPILKPGNTSNKRRNGGNKHITMSRSLRACEKRLTETNHKIAEYTREILRLEERYSIHSQRRVEPEVKEAVLETPVTADALKYAVGVPTKLMLALVPAEQLQRERKKQALVLAKSKSAAGKELTRAERDAIYHEVRGETLCSFPYSISTADEFTRQIQILECTTYENSEKKCRCFLFLLSLLKSSGRRTTAIRTSSAAHLKTSRTSIWIQKRVSPKPSR
jgi:hypothetical protein|eukprot:COSAG06_NODE_4177_length_4481_cov_13.193636_2_plen_450_part_00